MGILSVVGYVSIGIVIFAYLIYDPVPKGCDQNAMVVVTLSMIKFFNYVSRGLGMLGLNEPVINRKLMASFSSMSPVEEDPDIKVSNMEFNGVPVRLFTPKNIQDNARAIVWYHGGGWTFGDADTYQGMLSEAAKHVQAVTLYVEYRLSPENAFPAAIDDCESATRHFINNAKQFGIDKNRVALVGDSAGGTLTAVIARRLRNGNFKPMPKIQVMIYPVTQGVDFDTPSYRFNKNGPFLTKSYMVMYIASFLFGNNYTKYWSNMMQNQHTTSIVKKSNAITYLNVKNLPSDEMTKDYTPKLEHGNAKIWNEVSKKLTDPEFSPLFAQDLAGLPSAFVSTCQNDVLRDDGIFYAKRLQDVGVDVTHVNIPACYHGWIWHRGFSKKYKAEFNKILSYIDTKL